MAAKKRAKKTTKKSPFHVKLRPTPALAAVVGPAPLSRGQASKKVWAYIKRHKLQGKLDKRMIVPDAKLSRVLGTRSLSMFAMTKKISANLKKV